MGSSSFSFSTLSQSPSAVHSLSTVTTRLPPALVVAGQRGDTWSGRVGRCMPVALPTILYYCGWVWLDRLAVVDGCADETEWGS